MGRLIDLMMVTLLLVCSLATAYNLGLVNAENEPISPCFEVSNGLNTYGLDRHSVYHSEAITDESGTAYYIYIENSYSRTIIECVDTVIEGQEVSATEWKESIMMTLAQEIL